MKFYGDTMVDYIFRQYDIRGKIGTELAIDEVYRLVKAIAYYFVQKNPQVKKVAVGADGRIHSPAIKEEVCRALQDSGLDVVFVGVCPSPVLYFALFNLPVDAGLMITASHNGKEYNGIKICLGKDSVWGEQIQEIKELAKKDIGLKASRNGDYQEYPLIEDYTTWMVENFPHLVDMSLSVIVDCGNGAAGTVWPKLIEKMKWRNVLLLFQEVDGNYPNHEADPIVEKNMLALRAALKNSSYDLGLGLDGDCDRMTPMTKTGELVQGDKVLALFSQPIINANSGASVVFDIKCSSGLSEILTSWGGTPCISPSGHSIIKKNLKEKKALLAGELSCHFFFADRYFGYDDGNYAALRLFELLLQEQKPLEQLLEIFPKKISTPEIRIACEQEKMASIVDHVKAFFGTYKEAQLMTIDGIRVSMNYGWGMVRASNTQPVLCLRFESDTKEGLEHIKKDFVSALIPYFSQSALEQNFIE
jgi:phosphomannomutase/phosphoglucomutase